MKKFVCLILSLFLTVNVFAQNESSKTANRRTSLRYLQLAKQYSSENDWVSVVKSCTAGLEYDDSVADLYYLEALGLINLGKTRFDVIPVIAMALDEDKVEWVDYNYSNARVFYADLLACTGKPEEALSVLDKAPLIYSSDAEYVRIKSYYEINTPESIAKAEDKIDTVRRVYPNDARFFYLFFGYEYNLLYKENETKNGFIKQQLSPAAKKICDSFISHVPDYDNGYDDLEIYASIFSEGETQKRLLKAFSARGFKNVLYPVAALEAGVMTEEEAVDYFMSFIDTELDAKLLFQFYSMIKDENLKKYFDEHLDAFNGTLVYDTNNTLEANLIVKYERGRAISITYDKDNDSNLEWEVTCDFGSPKEIIVYDQSAIVKYGTYPNVNAILFKDIDPYVKGATIYTIIDETFVSKPFDIVKSPFVTDTDFYIIDESTLKSSSELFDVEKIVYSANTMTKPTLEVQGGHIVFSIIDGIPYKADYFNSENSCYASSRFFESGDVCAIRHVDKDGDSIYELTEFYKVDDGSMNLSDKERDALTTNIWGSPLVNSNIYLSEIWMDCDNDTEFDFFESYFENGKKESVWDSDFDGKVDIIYRKKSSENEKKLLEENSYYVSSSSGKKYWITIAAENSTPVYIIEDYLHVGYTSTLSAANENSDVKSFIIFENDDYEKVPVVSGKSEKFFWLNQKEDDLFEDEILSGYESIVQGQIEQKEYEDCFINYVLVNSKIYAKKTVKNTENEIQNESNSNGDNTSNEIN
ncbi:MAG: hypothetical protein KBT21_02550 [Treponema sp.]|nr:hypothetical protein [Candidatus Treponema merdequi]